MTTSDDDCPAVVGYLRKAQMKWDRLSRILGREGEKTQVSRIFFKSVVQAVLLFGSETWVMTPRMGRTLGGFQHRVDRQISGRQPQLLQDGSWEYPPLEEAMWEAGLQEVESYVLRRQNTVAQYIATRPILGLCE